MVEIRCGEISSRDDFGSWLNTRGLIGEACEIGTHQGEFAGIFLQKWRGRKLWCIDPYLLGYDNQDPISHQQDRREDMKDALNILCYYPGRGELMPLTSGAAAESFKPEHFDFVYVDGCHQTDHVRHDIETYWPLLKHGGVMAGHDIVCPNEVNGGWGPMIQAAVWWWAELNNLPVYLIADARGPWSFYLLKP